MPKKQLVFFWRIHALHWIYINCFISSCLTRILTPSWLYLIDINNEGRSEYTPPLPHPPVVLLKVTRIFGPLLLVDGRALRELATNFYWSTCGENRQHASICRQADHWGASRDLISSKQGQISEVWFLSLDDEPIRGSHFSSFVHILPLKQYNGWTSMKSMRTQIILD